MALPISLIVDDGSPVNLAHWTHPAVKRPRLFANSFTEQFGDVCIRHGVRGKFTVLPMPAGLGRIDRSLNGVPQDHLRAFLRAVRRKIAPGFDITPEFLTHGPAVEIASGRFRHIYEDVLADQASAAELTDYLAHAMRILRSAGLSPNGVTSPWMAGIKNERRYAEAVARAAWRVQRRRLGWYFLHIFSRGRPRWPWVAWRSRKAGLATVMVPANTTDPFGPTQDAASARGARRLADEGVDRMLSSDGRTGRLPEVFQAGCPLTLLTHWQSLYSNGRRAGLGGLARLLERIEGVWGDRLRWMRCSELAAMVAAGSRPKHLCRQGAGAVGQTGP